MRNSNIHLVLSCLLLLLVVFLYQSNAVDVFSTDSSSSVKARSTRRRLTTNERQTGAESLSGLNFLKAVGKGIQKKIQYAKSEAVAELGRDPRQDQGVLSFQTSTNYAYQYGDDIINAVKTDGFQKQLGTQSVGTPPDEMFQQGFEQGISHGLAQGVQTGFDAGFNAGFQLGFQNGFDHGLHNGLIAFAIEEPKLTESVDVLFLEGYSNGYQEGLKEGFNAGLQERQKMNPPRGAETSLSDARRGVSPENNDWLKPDFVESVSPAEISIKPITEAPYPGPEASENDEKRVGVTTVLSDSTLAKVRAALGAQYYDNGDERTRVPYNAQALERDLEQALTMLYSKDSSTLSPAEAARTERILEALTNVLAEYEESEILRNQALFTELQNWYKRRQTTRRITTDLDSSTKDRIATEGSTDRSRIKLRGTSSSPGATSSTQSGKNEPFQEQTNNPPSKTTDSEESSTSTDIILFVIIIPGKFNQSIKKHKLRWYLFVWHLVVVCLLAACIGSLILWCRRQ
eukprot:g2600.t1